TSTDAIQRNAEAILKTSQAISDNESAVRLSTASIQQNHDSLAALTTTLNGLTLDKPANRIVAVALLVVFVAVFAMLLTLVWTMLGIRRSLVQIQTNLAAGLARSPTAASVAPAQPPT
ncbi:MAG TPA: hypothetical protein VGN88_12425, partial [Phycisphaerae bacterium]